jgi:pyrroloquinoline-quinone synthase
MKQFASTAFDKFSLLEHPFYKAWNDGNLTRTQIAVYAQEYGAFIRLISEGWQRVGENEIAGEEQEHYLSWKKFANSLHAGKIEATVPQVNELVSSTNKYFQSYSSAIGALYAFEAQQPGTASSKLQGLKEHYGDWHADETYFTIHAEDFEEPALLEEKFNALSDQEKIVAASACEETCSRLWDALTGIMQHQEVISLN